MGSCDGQTVIVTGAGQGLGRAHALAFGAAGANVIVNDLGVGRDGGSDADSVEGAHGVVAEIIAAGGTAEVNGADVSDWDQAGAMVQQAVDSFGQLDTLVCNAGFLRDRMLAGMSLDEWESVVKVHLNGHFVPARHAIEHWRARTKAGEDVVARVVNTTSGAGLAGSIGQGNYATAKAGIACLTLQQAAEWGRYGVMVNAIAPDARTRMTAGIFYEAEAPEGWDEKDPGNASPLTVWLGSPACDITGRVFEVSGNQLNVCDGWQKGPVVDTAEAATMSVEQAAELAHRSIDGAPAPFPVYGTS